MARKLKSATDALIPEKIVMRDELPSEEQSEINAINSAENSLNTTKESYESSRTQRVQEAQNFIDSVISSTIDSAVSRGEFSVFVNIPQELEEYALLLLRNTYFYNVTKVNAVNNIFRIDWSNIIVYRAVSDPFSQSLYYRQEQEFNDITIIYSYYLASAEEPDRQLYRKETLSYNT